MRNDLSRKQTEITAMRNHHTLLCNRLSEVRNELDALETKKKALQLQSEEASEKVFQLCKELEVIKNKHNIEVGCKVRAVDGSYTMTMDTNTGSFKHETVAFPGCSAYIRSGTVIAIKQELPVDEYGKRYNQSPNDTIVVHGDYSKGSVNDGPTRHLSTRKNPILLGTVQSQVY
jgi:hypothetical protein